MASGSRTVAQVLRQNNGTALGFDFLRLALSVLILLWHCFVVTHSIAWSLYTIRGPWRGIIHALVPMFFSLSGFLVTGSMLRTGHRLHVFLMLRALRIVPALMAETLLSAFLLGSFATSLPMTDYFTSPGFYAYMLNIVGWVHYSLPWVFETNPWPGYVNLSLWTLPAELGCYLLLCAVMLADILRPHAARLCTQTAPKYAMRLLVFLPPWRIALSYAFLFATIILTITDPAGFIGQGRANMVSRTALVMCFTAGGLIRLWADRVHLRLRYLLAGLTGYCYCVYFCPQGAFLIGSTGIAYVTVWLGLMRLPRIPLLMHGDYSYGIYLYAYPIEQTIVWFFPSLRYPLYVFLLATPATLLFAIFSWHCIEKPALSLRRKILPQSAAITRERDEN